MKRALVSAICFLLAAPAFSAAAAAGDMPRDLLMKRLASEPPTGKTFESILAVKIADAEETWLEAMK